MKFLIVFSLLSIFNVVFSTARSLITIKGGKFVAALTSGGYFAFYNIMLIYTVADFPMWQKCLITFASNVIGVWIVKFIEEKMQKDKLWKIEITIPSMYTKSFHDDLNFSSIAHNYIENVGRYSIFNVYAPTKEISSMVIKMANNYGGKTFATETKLM